MSVVTQWIVSRNSQVVAQVIDQVTMGHAVLIFPLLDSQECKEIRRFVFFLILIIFIDAFLGELGDRKISKI